VAARPVHDAPSHIRIFGHPRLPDGTARDTSARLGMLDIPKCVSASSKKMDVRVRGGDIARGRSEKELGSVRMGDRPGDAVLPRSNPEPFHDGHNRRAASSLARAARGRRFVARSFDVPTELLARVDTAGFDCQGHAPSRVTSFAYAWWVRYSDRAIASAAYAQQDADDFSRLFDPQVQPVFPQLILQLQLKSTIGRQMHARHLSFVREGLLIADLDLAIIIRDILDTCKRFTGLVDRWGGDVLPELLDDQVGNLVKERAAAVHEISAVSRLFIHRFG